MRAAVRNVLYVSAVCVMALAVGCGSDGGDGGGTDIVTTPDTSVSDGRVLFRATLKDFSTKVPVPGTECWLLYNSYPEDFAQWESDGTKKFTRVPQDVMDQITGGGYTNPLVAGPLGELEIRLPADSHWGFECDKDGPDVVTWRETYQFQISSMSATFDGEEIWVIPNGLYSLAPTAAGITLDESLGVVAGRLVWINAAGAEEYVGCGKVTTEPVTDDIRYFGSNDYPTKLAAEGGRDDSHPINGLFIGANLPLGEVVMTAKVGAAVLGREAIFSKGKAVVIANIQVGRGVLPEDVNPLPDDANPTPPAAQCQ